MQHSCCCRPELQISSEGREIGSVKDVGYGLCIPCLGCAAAQNVFDSAGQKRFSTYGSFLQCGVFCPCCDDVKFQVRNNTGQRSDGEIRKVFGGLAEMCTGDVNNMKIVFPSDASEEDKVLLFGATILLDNEYFERANK